MSQDFSRRRGRPPRFVAAPEANPEDQSVERVSEEPKQDETAAAEAIAESNMQIFEAMQSMESAPLDGERIYLVDMEGSPVLGYWRRTRKFHRGTWEESELWAKWPTHVPLGFEPIGWLPEA